jgi:hypothetical protein
MGEGAANRYASPVSRKTWHLPPTLTSRALLRTEPHPVAGSVLGLAKFPTAWKGENPEEVGSDGLRIDSGGSQGSQQVGLPGRLTFQVVQDSNNGMSYSNQGPQHGEVFSRACTCSPAWAVQQRPRTAELGSL